VPRRQTTTAFHRACLRRCHVLSRHTTCLRPHTTHTPADATHSALRYYAKPRPRMRSTLTAPHNTACRQRDAAAFVRIAAKTRRRHCGTCLALLTW